MSTRSASTTKSRSKKRKSKSDLNPTNPGEQEALHSRRHTHLGHVHFNRSPSITSHAQSLPPLHMTMPKSRADTLPENQYQRWYPEDKPPPERSHTHTGHPPSFPNKHTPRSKSLPPITSPRSVRSEQVDAEDTVPILRSPSVISRYTLYDQELMGSQMLLNQLGNEIMNPVRLNQLTPRQTPAEMLMPKTQEKEEEPKIKEPRHPRNIYINKKLSELETLTKRLREGPWADQNTPWEESKAEKRTVKIEGPYTLDEIIYEEDEAGHNDDALQIHTNRESVKDRGNKIGTGNESTKIFEVPLAYDDETGEVKGEFAKAAALISSVRVDPRESKPAADPSLPSLCDCCADMNEHTKHLASLEADKPRPRVYQAKKLEEVLGEKQTEAAGYYRSESPTLIPVSTFMDRDLASEEMLKVGVAKDMVEKLRQISRPKDLSVSQIPWPFYAHDMASSNDLAQYLDNGLPAATDAMIQVNIGEANHKYKDSMNRLEKVMRKFRK